MSNTQTAPRTAALAFGTLGIVFGDIGTSPLYAFRESFEVSDLPVDSTSALGIASVVFWSLIVVISLKYLLLVMRADNHGEGGILALTALVMTDRSAMPSGIRRAVIALGVFGTALLYGDGLITPAISVLAAVEGFEVATEAFEHWVVPVSVAILLALFSVQRRGTAGISRVFSPVMVVWFGTLGVLGARQIFDHPDVLRAVSPTYAVDLFVTHPYRAFLALGSIFLVVTGGEALYADLGHFGRRPIQWAWYGLVLPGLLLNYFGQAAYLAAQPRDGVGALFYSMAPRWATTPLAILATCATVIASQALISGAFSLTVQAVNLDYFPRLAVRHTSAHHVGQVYVPLVNWLLAAGCVGLVVTFQTSSNLAAAYGIAVTTTMLITTLIFYRVTRDRWGWSAPRALATITPFFVVDVAFLGANLPKIPNGGWVPLAVGFGLVIQMTTWRRGRQLVAIRQQRTHYLRDDLPGQLFTEATRVPGVAAYLTKDPAIVPPALIANLRHHRALHELTLLVSVDTAEVPHVGYRKRAHYTTLGEGLYHVQITFGFLDAPDVPAVLGAVTLPHAAELDTSTITYFLGRESIAAGKVPGMNPLREQLFVVLNRGAANAARFFHLPPDQVLEVGTQVTL